MRGTEHYNLDRNTHETVVYLVVKVMGRFVIRTAHMLTAAKMLLSFQKRSINLSCTSSNKAGIRYTRSNEYLLLHIIVVAVASASVRLVPLYLLLVLLSQLVDFILCIIN